MAAAVPRRYGVDICYGTCQIDRCLETLRFWEEGLDAAALCRRVLSEAASPDMKASTVGHFVREVFAHRFLTPEGLPWTRVLRRHAAAMPRTALVQVLLLLTARWDPMLSDFLLLHYWPAVHAGRTVFPGSAPLDFLEDAAREGRPGALWSETRLRRIRKGLGGLCSGYGLWRRPSPVAPFTATPPVLHPEVARLLACELHERGLADDEVVAHRDWGFFGLDREGAIRALSGSRFVDTFLLQAGAGSVFISWKKTMMEAAERHDH